MFRLCLSLRLPPKTGPSEVNNDQSKRGMDFPHEGKYNVQSIQVHLHSLVKQLLFQHLKIFCMKGRRGGREEAVPRVDTNIKFCKPGVRVDLLNSVRCKTSLLLTTTPDHKEAQGMDAETPLGVVTKAIIWLTLPKPSQTWGMKEALLKAVTAPVAKKHKLVEASH